MATQVTVMSWTAFSVCFLSLQGFCYVHIEFWGYKLYCVSDMCSKQKLIVEDRDRDKFVQNVVTIQGLTSSGYLSAIGDDNQMCELHPDGNR
uniref:Biotin--protein ligase 1, chloroplastic n=1 Tax=Noccaea caerulescens TaxID=107243 RepID=A0A1J3JCE4_NOCCA